ncbi:hypothetical protein FKW77_002777 [Venturia effusa]|uniref:Uncharacterized protein n=1 Tax=Venturia effusa TaxID=50376 RepID=A0A517LL34_9PEZI|nr:hypothetical protein FKW77_002777 [Venturia effusa]
MSDNTSQFASSSVHGKSMRKAVSLPDLKGCYSTGTAASDAKKADTLPDDQHDTTSNIDMSINATANAIAAAIAAEAKEAKKAAKREKRERRAQTIAAFISPVVGIVTSVVLNLTL